MKQFFLRRPGVAIFAAIIKILYRFIKKSLKTHEKLKELEIMYQNAIFICISWGMSHDSYIFWIFFR